MPRSIWNGTITFGRIAVPVKVSSVIEDKSVHFHQVHLRDGARVTQKRVCSKDGKEVAYKDVAKGYERSDGEYVLLSDEDIAAAAGEKSHRIELEEFVCAPDIDPVFYDRTYYLGAGSDGEAPYRLVHDALAATDRVGIGRWVFHNREYLVAVRAREEILVLHTMRFADEVASADELELPEPKRAPGKREIEMARTLVDSLQDSFDPSAFSDEHRKALLALIRRKAKGEAIEIPSPPQPEASSDLVAALEASLGKGGSSGSSSGRGAARGAKAGSRSGRGRRASSRSRGH